MWLNPLCWCCNVGTTYLYLGDVCSLSAELQKCSRQCWFCERGVARGRGLTFRITPSPAKKLLSPSRSLSPSLSQSSRDSHPCNKGGCSPLRLAANLRRRYLQSECFGSAQWNPSFMLSPPKEHLVEKHCGSA
ncbi:Uncharacterized protein Fot_31078 [Forsythia ovata]|uniref:Uncharacterized protein n=1 Tax=Forsythia ovata TaxID=205694 RepID=A0ABD1T2P7_9LAMI